METWSFFFFLFTDIASALEQSLDRVNVQKTKHNLLGSVSLYRKS